MLEIKQLAAQIYCKLVVNPNIHPSITDIDVVLDPNGGYYKIADNSYTNSVSLAGLSRSKVDRYRVITTESQRLVRMSYDFAKVFIEESRLNYYIE